jgi:hypothetical protein
MLTIVAVVIASIVCWELVRAVARFDMPSHALRIDVTNSTDRWIAAYLIDPLGGRKSTLRDVGPGKSVNWGPALVGDGLPLESNPLYQVLVLDDRNQVIWQQGLAFHDAQRLEAIKVSAGAGGLTASVSMRPVPEGKSP